MVIYLIKQTAVLNGHFLSLIKSKETEIYLY